VDTNGVPPPTDEGGDIEVVEVKPEEEAPETSDVIKFKTSKIE
jgi:hypothetical protein